ncbi:helix-turn-helix domain-containing protein [Streptomyces sp. NPDC050095]|uniref:helix-turn-helix domain-containing protein n=1 Tax=unclassified Streptomyces TaxID=2593676 RepID=UPI003425DB4C
MSDTNTTPGATVHELRPLTDFVPEPLASLTGAPATAYTHLSAHPDGITVAELALAAGLGRSTTGKALITLESHGLAVRTPGGHDGPRRTPDRWHPAPVSDQDTASTNPCEAGPAPAHTTEADTDREPAEAPGSPVSENVTPATAPTECVTADGPYPAEGAAENEVTPPITVAQAMDMPGKSEEPVPPPVATAQQAEVPVGTKVRLAPGDLRQLVIDHLAAHPDDAFTATGISRAISKSSGAIANALVTLTKQNVAEQVSDRPRTYRLARTATPTTDSPA